MTFIRFSGQPSAWRACRPARKEKRMKVIQRTVTLWPRRLLREGRRPDSGLRDPEPMSAAKRASPWVGRPQ